MTRRQGNANTTGRFWGPGERTLISIVTEITIVWLAGWGVSAAWFIGWLGVYLIWPLVYAGVQLRSGVRWWGIWDNISGWLGINWPFLLAWWLIGVPLSCWALVYRFWMEIVYKDWLPHPEKNPPAESTYSEQEIEDIPAPLYEVRGQVQIGKKTIYTIFKLTKEAEAGFHEMCKTIIADDRLNFSGTVAKKHGIESAEWQKIIKGFEMSVLVDPKTVAPRKIPKLTAAGRAMVRNFANTPPPTRP